jgi:hypothetical protein
MIMARYEHQMFFEIGYHSWNQEPVNIQLRKPGVLAGLTPLALETDPPISLLPAPKITHKPHKPHKSEDLQSPEELLEGLAQGVTIGKLHVSHP